MQKCTALLFVFLLSFPALGERPAAKTVEGSTYFLRRSLSLPAKTSCTESLDRLSAVLFGPKAEHSHLAAYSSLTCFQNLENPLQVEVLFEVLEEGDLAELETWMQTLELQTWEGQSLKPQFVNSIFWDTYGAALKKDNTYVGTFESPRVSYGFFNIVEAKNKMKAGLNSKQLADFQNFLKSQIGEREFGRWQKEVLPAAHQVTVQIAIYFLTSEGTAEKSLLNFQLMRDCSQLACL